MVHVPVMGEIRMPPVDYGIQAHPDPLLPESVQEFPHQVPPAGGIGGLEVRQLRIEQAEAVMVLGRQHRVLHAGLLRHPGPFLRIVVLRGELVLEGLVLLPGELLGAAQPFPSGGDGVESPVDEHAEPGLPVPLRPPGPLFHNLVHCCAHPRVATRPHGRKHPPC